MKRAVLKARARVLSKPLPRVEPKVGVLEVVEFILANETYAVETKSIKEVHYLKDVTKLPNAPDFVIGVINLHGQIIAVIDIKRFFALSSADITVFNKVIIVEHEDVTLGFIADEVLGVREIDESTVQLSLVSLAGRRARFISGITNDRVTILDVKKMLQDKEILVDEEVSVT